jgi:hypothetical protein
MNYQKITEGQRFNPSASLHNDTIDLLSKVQQQDFREGAFGDSVRSVGNALLVRVKNSSGGNLDILTACLIGSSEYSLVNDDEEQTARRIVFNISKTTATFTTPFCVTASPIPQNGFGWAYIAGIFPAKVTNGASTVATGYQCDLEDGSGNLTVAKLGRARVLVADGEHDRTRDGDRPVSQLPRAIHGIHRRQHASTGHGHGRHDNMDS